MPIFIFRILIYPVVAIFCHMRPYGFWFEHFASLSLQYFCKFAVRIGFLDVRHKDFDSWLPQKLIILMTSFTQQLHNCHTATDGCLSVDEEGTLTLVFFQFVLNEVLNLIFALIVNLSCLVHHPSRCDKFLPVAFLALFVRIAVCKVEQVDGMKLLTL